MSARVLIGSVCRGRVVGLAVWGVVVVAAALLGFVLALGMVAPDAFASA